MSTQTQHTIRTDPSDTTKDLLHSALPVVFTFHAVPRTRRSHSAFEMNSRCVVPAWYDVGGAGAFHRLSPRLSRLSSVCLGRSDSLPRRVRLAASGVRSGDAAEEATTRANDRPQDAERGTNDGGTHAQENTASGAHATDGLARWWHSARSMRE